MATHLERAQKIIEAAQLKLDQAKARAALIKARGAATLAKEERTKSTRRKTLLGVAVLQAVAQGRMSEAQMLALVDAGLTRAHERALFGLPPLAQQGQQEGQQAQG